MLPSETSQDRARRLPRARLRAIARGALLTVALAACGEREHPLRRVERGEATVTGHGVLVIAIDGLRYDRTSLGRNDRDTTPFLRRLAKEGIEFSDTWSTVPARFDAHVSLLTGDDPLVGRRPPLPQGAGRGEAVSFPVVVPPDAPSLAVRFLAGGWTTVAFVDHGELSRVRGLDRGFREFVEHGGRGSANVQRGEGVYGVGARFLHWLNARDLDEDWFAYLHMGDLERTFRQPALPVPAGWEADPARVERLPVGRADAMLHTLPASRVAGGSAVVGELELSYDVALLALDRSLERIVRHVDEFGRAREITIVIVGTYGVPFGESGLYLTPGLPDGPDLRVPWVVRPSETHRRALGLAPASQAGNAAAPQAGAGAASTQGRRIEALASLLDVAPTLLELAALPVPNTMHGFSRLAELRDPAAPSPRHCLYVRSHIGGGACIVTETEQWASLRPARSTGDLAESWTGVLEADPTGDVRALARRSGPSASDSLHLSRPAPVDAARFAEFSQRWTRWARTTHDVREALHFDAGRGSDAFAAELRALQGPPREL